LRLVFIGHAGTVVGILAGGLATTAPLPAPSTDAMLVDTTPAASTSTASTTPATPALSIAAQKKLEDAKAERERKYPGVPRRGIVLAAEKKVTSKLLEKDMGSSEKVYLVNGSVFSSRVLPARASIDSRLSRDRNILSAVAGITADANSLVSYARNAAQVHFYSFPLFNPLFTNALLDNCSLTSRHITKTCQLNNWSRRFVTSNKVTLNTEVGLSLFIVSLKTVTHLFHHTITSRIATVWSLLPVCRS
jgi:hypothetical protein